MSKIGIGDTISEDECSIVNQGLLFRALRGDGGTLEYDLAPSTILSKGMLPLASRRDDYESDIHAELCEIGDLILFDEGGLLRLSMQFTPLSHCVGPFEAHPFGPIYTRTPFHDPIDGYYGVVESGSDDVLIVSGVGTSDTIHYSVGVGYSGQAWRLRMYTFTMDTVGTTSRSSSDIDSGTVGMDGYVNGSGGGSVPGVAFYRALGHHTGIKFGQILLALEVSCDGEWPVAQVAQWE